MDESKKHNLFSMKATVCLELWWTIKYHLNCQFQFNRVTVSTQTNQYFMFVRFTTKKTDSIGIFCIVSYNLWSLTWTLIPIVLDIILAFWCLAMSHIILLCYNVELAQSQQGPGQEQSWFHWTVVPSATKTSLYSFLCSISTWF